MQIYPGIPIPFFLRIVLLTAPDLQPEGVRAFPRTLMCKTLVQVAAHARWITALTLHPSAWLIAAASEDAHVSIWAVSVAGEDISAKNVGFFFLSKFFNASPSCSYAFGLQVGDVKRTIIKTCRPCRGRRGAYRRS
ncbi:hypothetical protein T492DRAFT_919210 [Pavlovales sp. CCMP2436]|nr:hypothetical protein T492DRAFT_919210 [Pavlovales sp. CCMP2436]